MNVQLVFAQSNNMTYNKDYYLANKEKFAERSKKWRATNIERAKENRRRYYLENINKEKDYSTKLNRLRRTGVSDEQYQIQLDIQKNVCAICNGTCSKALAADHDHTTGVFRGLLCNNCNRGLGHFKDDPQLLFKAMEYLK